MIDRMLDVADYVAIATTPIVSVASTQAKYGRSTELFRLARTIIIAGSMNFIVWLNLMASVVLQGLFPSTVDSPLLKTNDTISDTETESEDEEEEFAIFRVITSSLAAGFVMLATFEPTTGELQLNETESKTTDDDSFYVTGCFTVHDTIVTHVHTRISAVAERPRDVSCN